MLQPTSFGRTQDDAQEPPEAPDASPGDPAAAALRAMLDLGLQRLRHFHPEASAGSVEGVHRLRTTTRRLRSTLDLFGPLVEASWSDPLDDELKWLGGLLGEVRDLDVLDGRFRRAAGELGVDADLAPLREALGARLGPARGALREALGGERLAAIVATLAGSLDALPLVDDAQQPCRDALPPLVARAWKGLKRTGRALRTDDPDEAFHEVRKRAKRARYAAELARNALDPGPAGHARSFARRAREVQDVLGEHQDAAVAVHTLREVAADHAGLGPFNLAAGQLLHRERMALETTRDAFFRAWPRLDRKKNLRWLRP